VSLPADLRVRRMEASDDGALRVLARACDETYLSWAPRGWTVPEAPPGWMDRYFGNGLVALAGEALVATVAYRRVDNSAVANVGLVLVHPSRWREGIAGTLLGRVEEEMIERGFVREQLWTPLGAPAEAFYGSRGWERDGRTEWHPWVGLEMVGYARDLV
jgi:GNAT superfamily N-acetyltransferase